MLILQCSYSVINFQLHSQSSQVCTHSIFIMYQPVPFQTWTVIFYKQYFVILYTALMSSKQILKHTCASFSTWKLFSFKDGSFMTCVT